MDRTIIERITEALEEAPELLPPEIVFGWTVGTSTLENGDVTRRFIFGREPRCSDSQLVDVSGIARTGADGHVTLSLNDFHCHVDLNPDAGDNFLRYAPPATVQAAAIGREARTVTYTAQVRSDGTDVDLDVFSFDAAGSPAATTFSFRCVVPVRTIIG